MFILIIRMFVVKLFKFHLDIDQIKSILIYSGKLIFSLDSLKNLNKNI